MSKKRQVRGIESSTTTTVEGGETRTSSSERIIYSMPERRFVKLFIGELVNEHGEMLIHAPFNMGLALMIVAKMEYDSRVDLSPAWRKSVIGTHFARQTFYKSLKGMKEWGFLRECPDGRYMVNPHIVASGSATNVAKLKKEWEGLKDEGVSNRV